MVGLKSVWITIIALFLLAACVPQTKKTECASNEAFNATLRTCVPVMGGPTSFINVDSASPALPISVYKNDTQVFTFSITVANPYNQSYTIEWERVYNGLGSYFAGNTTTTTLIPVSLATEVGNHFITAKVISGGRVVDSHTFQVNISNLPRPVIMSSSISPASYNVTLTPSSPAQAFSFTVDNNNAVVMGANYTVSWTLSKNGVDLPAYADSDSFTNMSQTGTQTFHFGDLPTVPFLPGAAALGIGNYVLRAVVANTIPGETVGEQQWSITVKHPNVSPIVSRDLYESVSSPGWGTTVIAYDGVPYNDAPSSVYNFNPVGQVSNRAQFCVDVGNGDGTYVGGGGVRVDFLLDGATTVYSASTTAGNPEICLSDSAAALAATVFTNTLPNVTQTHTIVARVYDEDSLQEYTSANMGAGLGSYPITWTIEVRPKNSAPTVNFTADSNLSNITCATALGATRSCNVTQDTIFRLGIHAVDEFYSTSSTTDTDQNKFQYTMVLYKNGSAIQSCQKSSADNADNLTPPNDYVGPDYFCDFYVPSWDADGPVPPAATGYSVVITFSDTQSEITGSGPTTSTTLTYNLNVTEYNQAPIIDSQGTTTSDSFVARASSPSTVIEPSSNALHYATEGETVNFNVLVNESQRDDHEVRLYVCLDFTSSCGSPSLITTLNVIKTDGILGTLSTLSYIIPENLLPPATGLTTNVPTYFKVEVTDTPDTLPSITSSAIFDINIRNRNPAPQFGTGSTSISTRNVLVGYPITFSAGLVTDASTPSSGEGNIYFKWYVDVTGTELDFRPIDNSDTNVLTWTPSSAIAADTLIHLRVCVSDGTAVNPFPAANSDVDNTGMNPANGANCRGNWPVRVKPNLLALPAENIGGGELGSTAIWQDTTVASRRVVYSAYVEGDYIYIDKTVFTSTGTIYSTPGPYDSTNKGFETVRFSAHSVGGTAAGTVKDISIIGDADYIFLAYQSADVGAPSSPKIKLRRFSKNDTTEGTKTDSSFPITSKFGYSYSQLDLNETSAEFSIPAVVAPAAQQIELTTTNPTAGEQVLIGPAGSEYLTINVSDTPTATELCSSLASGCTPGFNVTRIADLINSSASSGLQGYTAVADVTNRRVYIYGAVGEEHLDGNASVQGFTVGKLGKLMIIGGSWYLPFVDLSTAGNINKLRVLSASTSTQFTSAAAISVSNTGDYNALGIINNFTNEANLAGEMTIASVNSLNTARISTYTTANVATNSVILFGGAPVVPESIRLSASVTGNANFYAAAKALVAAPSTYNWKIGRYNASLVMSMESNFTTAAYNVTTSTVLDPDEIEDLTIQTYPHASLSTEARLLVVSRAGGASPNLYAVNFRSDNKLSCGVCQQINYGTQVLPEAADNILLTSTVIDTAMLIGTSGSTANENTKDVFFALIPISTGGVFRPHFGIFNSSIESIQSTTTETVGTAGHRSPFYSDN